METFKKFCRHTALFINEEITQQQLDQIETYADRLFKAVNVDINFTRHFIDRVNDRRNQKPINTAELTRLFKQTYKKHGKKIPKMGDDAQAVIRDMQTDINMPFVLAYDDRNKELDLVAKTIMRKRDFKTPNRKLEI